MEDALAELEAKVKAGADMEELLKGADWKDFEGLVSEIFAANGFKTFRNFRFSSKKRRYEVDVVALEKPRIVIVDCKHWSIRAGKAPALRAAASANLKRATEFGSRIQEFPRMADWTDVSIVPTIVTLYQEGVTEESGVFIVPVFKLPSFIEGLRSGLLDAIRVRNIRLDQAGFTAAAP